MNRVDVSREELRFRVLRLIDDDPYASQRKMSESLGVSLGRINYCLRALVGKGLLKIKNFRKSGNKLGYVYLLTPEGISEKTHLTEAFLRRKVVEYELLCREIEAVRADMEITNNSDT
jgi:EPS-associated MarR family transcriptional regulator